MNMLFVRESPKISNLSAGLFKVPRSELQGRTPRCPPALRQRSGCIDASGRPSRQLGRWCAQRCRAGDGEPKARKGPSVSRPTGSKVAQPFSVAYLAFCPPLRPRQSRPRAWTYQGCLDAQERTIVASDAIGNSPAYGSSVRPSERLPSDRVAPDGSRIDATPVTAIARFRGSRIPLEYHITRLPLISIPSCHMLSSCRWFTNCD